MLGGPVPTTARLVLRRFASADADAFAALNADPDVMRFIGDGAPLTRAQSDELLARIAGHWRSHGFGLWCLAERGAPERCLGFAGLAVPSFLPEVLPAVEVGWRLARDAWGRGLATEAARAALAEAFGPLELAAVISIIAEGNEQSVRVAEKLHMRRGPDRVHPVRGRLAIYEISADDAGSSPAGS
jgi:RimJ/RimL family protein N-acetyltransferase